VSGSGEESEKLSFCSIDQPFRFCQSTFIKKKGKHTGNISS